MYFFVYYTANIIIRSNVAGYSVELFGKSVAQKTVYDCPDEICSIPDVSPLEYNITIQKDGYEDFFQNINITPRTQHEIIVTLEKYVTLEKITSETKNTQEIADSAQEKIIQLRQEKQFDRIFTLSSGNKIGIKSQENRIQLYHILGTTEKIIDTFDRDASVVSVKEIPQTQYLFIGIGNSKYIYHTQAFTLSQLSLQPNIRYIKPGNSLEELLFITDVWAFVYNSGTQDFSYFYLFHDFVYEQESYIGVIYKDEEQKRRNYWWEEETQHLVVRYVPSTQTREIIFRTNLDVDQILKEDNTLIIISEGERYELKNYK